MPKAGLSFSGGGKTTSPGRAPGPNASATIANKARRKRSSICKDPTTPLSVAFRSIRPSWRDYVVYVEMAAQDGDEDMELFMQTYNSLPSKERAIVMPERICSLSGIKTGDLLGTVCKYLWQHSMSEADIITAINHPRVIERLAKEAQRGKNFSDREVWLKGTGFLPTPKGAQFNINSGNRTLAIGGGDMPGAGPIGLPSMESDILDIEASTDPARALPPAANQ